MAFGGCVLGGVPCRIRIHDPHRFKLLSGTVAPRDLHRKDLAEKGKARGREDTRVRYNGRVWCWVACSQGCAVVMGAVRGPARAVQPPVAKRSKDNKKARAKKTLK